MAVAHLEHLSPCWLEAGLLTRAQHKSPAGTRSMRGCAVQGPRRSISQQAIDRRMDSAQDVHPGQLGRPNVPRTVLSGFDRPLPVIYSAQPSEAAVT